MKCDKCGFEHNSRSTCPKCGASVIYVNEDYERRKREWEEAQKSGKGSVIPPGIMHSTKEEHDIRTGKDRMINVKQEGGSEMMSLSFAVIKEKFIKFIAKIIVWFGKHKKKRGANNPIIRKLEFDNTPDTLDTSKLVLSHKIFKDNRKWFLIAGIAIVILGVGIPVTVHNIKRIDKSDIIYVSENGIFSVNKNKTLYEISDMESVIKVNSQNILITTDKEVVICKSGKITSFDVNKPELITYNDNLSALLLTSGDKIFFYDGSLHEIETDSGELDNKGCMISDNGDFFVLTTINTGKDSTDYSIYYGNGEYTKHLSLDEKRKNILDVYNDGTFLYLDMTDAEYGIVNDRAITYFDGQSFEVIAANLVEYRYSDEKDTIYFIDKDRYLYAVSEDRTTKIDNEVNTFCDNVCNENIFYLKDDGCYLAEINSDYKIPLFKTNQNEITLYYDESDNYLYYADMAAVYYVSGLKKSKTGEKVCSLRYGDTLFHDDENGKLYSVDENGTLMMLDNSQTVLQKNISNFILMTNSEGFSFEKNGSRYVVNNKNKGTEISSSDYGKKWNELIYSRKYVYFVDENNRMYKASLKKGNVNYISDVKNCIFMG